MALSLRQSAAADSEGPAPQGIQEIPLPDFELCDDAQNVYWEHCQKLRSLGLLTSFSREDAQSLALAVHNMQLAIAKKQSLRYPMDQRTSALRRLEKLYGDTPVSASPNSTNPYAAFGFAKRARQRRHNPHRG